MKPYRSFVARFERDIYDEQQPTWTMMLVGVMDLQASS